MADFQPRYEPGRFRDCRWCGGHGCAGCDGEADKAFKRETPQLMATFHLDKPEEMVAFQDVFHSDRVAHAFGPEGRGHDELLERLKTHFPNGLPSE